MNFKVEMRTVNGGWEDADWTVDEQPARFATREEAGREISDHVQECREAVRAGHMDSAPGFTDFRVVEAA